MIFIDIETAPILESLRYLEQPVAPANYKDPEKIQAYIAAEVEKQKSRAALDPLTGRIIGLGVYRPGDMCKFYDGAEVQILSAFWREVFQARQAGDFIGGYNVLAFDLPFILFRSMANVVSTSIQLDLRRSSNNVFDLYGELYNWKPGHGLKTTCKILEIENDFPEPEIMPWEMSPDQLRDYCLNDVRLCYQLWNRVKDWYML